jgi:hypothetical protein
MLRLVTIGALLALTGGDALAQQMYRCGTTYSHEPCQGATMVQAAHQPAPAEARRATTAAQQDARRADAMEKERLAQEARAPKAIIIGGAEKPAQAKVTEPGQAKMQKGKKPDYFTATSPRPPGEAGKKKKS